MDKATFAIEGVLTCIVNREKAVHIIEDQVARGKSPEGRCIELVLVGNLPSNIKEMVRKAVQRTHGVHNHVLSNGTQRNKHGQRKLSLYHRSIRDLEAGLMVAEEFLQELSKVVEQMNKPVGSPGSVPFFR